MRQLSAIKYFYICISEWTSLYIRLAGKLFRVQIFDGNKCIFQLACNAMLAMELLVEGTKKKTRTSARNCTYIDTNGFNDFLFITKQVWNINSGLATTHLWISYTILRNTVIHIATLRNETFHGKYPVRTIFNNICPWVKTDWCVTSLNFKFEHKNICVQTSDWWIGTRAEINSNSDSEAISIIKGWSSGLLLCSYSTTGVNCKDRIIF